MANIIIEKTLGSVLLLAGLSIVGAGLYLGINVFIKAQAPPEIFKPAIITTNSTETSVKDNNTNTSVPKNLNEINPDELQKMVSSNLLSPEAIKSIIPPEMFGYTAKLMNLSVFTLFLWVLITGGTKIASLGVALIKSNSDIKF